MQTKINSVITRIKQPITCLPIFGLVILGCLLSIFLFYNRAMAPNDIILSQYERTLTGMAHPAGTSLIHSFSRVGWMQFPSPEACNFLVAEQRHYSGSKDDIKTFYSSMGLLNGNDRLSLPEIKIIDAEAESNYEPLSVVFSDDERFAKPCDELGLRWPLVSICHWVRSDVEKEAFYVVYVVTPGYLHAPGFDPRCNFIGW